MTVRQDGAGRRWDERRKGKGGSRIREAERVCLMKDSAATMRKRKARLRESAVCCAFYESEAGPRESQERGASADRAIRSATDYL